MNDNIKTYVMTASAGVLWYCHSCGKNQIIWVGETEGGETLTCCATCQCVLIRRQTASIPKLSVNQERT